MNLKKAVAYTAVALISIAMIYGYTVFKKAFESNTNFEESYVFVHIPTDATVEQSMDSIKKYVDDWEQFKSVFTQFEMDRNLIPGRFKIEKGMSNFKIAQALRRNIPVKVTFNNQETIQDLAKRLASQIEPSEKEILDIFLEEEFLNDNQATKEEALALFMPNTYEFYWNTNALKVRNVLHKEYIRFWNAERTQKAKDLNLSIVDVSTLASIVQKETAKVDERPKVAGAYLNRLNKGMLLQADPTVVYAKKLHLNNFDTIIKRVYLKDLVIDNPYNTYKNLGLPPGPIAMPDVSSIEAVLNPEKHDYIYFCASVERMGYHEFAKTLEEHSKNRAKYTAWLNEQNIK